MPKAPLVDFRAIKQAVTMEQVLQHYGLIDGFKRTGNGDSLSGPCPIHNGTNPTQFRVSVSKNCWNCFSDCKCGGNVLDFVARKEGCDFYHAALKLIEWFHLDEPREPEAEPPAPPVAKPVQPATQPKPAPEGSGSNKPLKFKLELEPEHPYLTVRGLTPDTVQEFSIGLCNAGTMIGRIAIPIHNLSGEIVGYIGRWPGESPPKETPKYKLPKGFKKSAEVFNLWRAMREPPEQPLVIVEGVFDVMKLWQHGYRKTIALMGSSLSPDQEALLVRVTDSGSRIILMLDEDDAGRAGRSEILARLATKMFVSVVAFQHEGQQPENLTAEEIATVIPQ